MQILARSLDHVALWVADRDTLASFLCDHLGMHEIERTDRFTLVGADARRGKLTLFAAEGPREPGVLRRVVLRVDDLEAALGALPAGLRVDHADGAASLEAPERLGLGLVEREGGDYDIDHVVLAVPEPERAAAELGTLGFERRDGLLTVADKHLRLERGEPATAERPLLNHLALLVDSAEQVHRDARRRGLEIEDFVDAANTLAVFVRGPDGVRIEYVEHKPGFALT